MLWYGEGVPVQAGKVLTPAEGAEGLLHHTLEPVHVPHGEKFLERNKNIFKLKSTVPDLEDP